MPPNASPTSARAVFDDDYLREHVTLGYAVTVHSAQGVTADTAHAVLGEDATRAMVYVAMTRGRDTNHAYLYTRDGGEADHDHHLPDPVADVHQLRRGTKHSAAHQLRVIVGNDDRPRTMHVAARQTDREDLPATIRRILDRHEQRLISRADEWQRHAANARGFRAACERMAATTPSASRGREVDGMEL